MAGVRETGACVIGMPSKDTIKLSDEKGFVSETPDRKNVWTIQTPQIFSYSLIRSAHESIRKKDMSQITDDAMVVEQETGRKSPSCGRLLYESENNNAGGSGDSGDFSGYLSVKTVKSFLQKNVKSILTPTGFDDRITSALTEQMRKKA